MATREEVLQELERHQKNWLHGRQMWSSTYHGLAWSSIFFAFATTLGAAVGWQKVALVVLGGLTTALTAATTLLRPASKWRSHRLCYGEAERIRLYLMRDKSSPDQALARLSTLIAAHDLAIVGDAGTDLTKQDPAVEEIAGTATAPPAQPPPS